MAVNQATRNNDVLEVTRLLESGAYADSRDPMGYTGLHVASWKGNTEILDVLIKARANANARGPWGVTPLMVAANEECAIKLVKAGANRNLMDHDGHTAALPS